jgi:uridine kinase
MNNMLIHFENYPQMQIQDMVKLIYQNEFAGGHMIKNEKDSLKHLCEEFSMVCNNQAKSEAESKNLFEGIGNGLLRINLGALCNLNINLTTINKFFCNTANSIKGNLKSFENKLEIFKEYCRNGVLPYSLEEVYNYIYNYKRKGYLPLSHSEIFNELYKPSYRVIKEVYGIYFEVFKRIDILMKTKDPIIIAIDGNRAAGKSTLAGIIKEIYSDSNIFHMDDFFLTPKLKTGKRLKELGGNVDYVRVKSEIIDGILSKEIFWYQIYSCVKNTMISKVKVFPEKLNIIEGSYSMHPTLIDNYSLKIFMGINKKEQSLRILKRNGPYMQKQFLNIWVPMEDKYIDGMNIKGKSDIVFDF